MRIFIAVLLLLTAAAAAFLWMRGMRLNAEHRAAVLAESAAEIRSGAAAVVTAEDETGMRYTADHVYSHRGTEGSYEHSFRAYDEAIAAGSRYIEQDLVLSSDGVLFVSHDLSAGAMTGNYSFYSSMSSDKIDGLRTWAGEKVLRLSEVFDRYKRDVNYVIELKTFDDDLIRAFEDIVDEYGYEDIITVQSRSPYVLAELEEKYPEMPKLIICAAWPEYYDALDMPDADIVCVSAEAGMMTEDNCRAVHDHGKMFSVWTIDSESEISKAISIGADTYFTNDTKLALLLERRYALTHGKR